ncbi:MAG: methyltransferase domain-containing protein [Kiloniellaceae bacterium]|nr:methyltransferase domain-containing protein [Kiloniellaceae bacterium]
MTRASKTVDGAHEGIFRRWLGVPLRTALRNTFSTYKASPITFEVVFSDGGVYRNRAGEPELSIRFKTVGAEMWTVLFTDMGLLDAYFDQTIDIHGDIAALVKLDAHADKGLSTKNAGGPHSNPLNILRNRWHKLRHDARTAAQAKANAEAHYDLPNEFFEIVLGRTFGYTCAYWGEHTETLDQAQHDKFAHICKKLALEPGCRLIEVGSGWGYLSLLAAKAYGAIVDNYGIVAAQNDYMQREIAAQGLGDRVRILEREHRSLGADGQQYDRYVSVGVYEHAQEKYLDDWIRSIARGLKEGGIGVLHFIGHQQKRETNYFIRHHVFPGCYVPGLDETVHLMSKYGLEVLQIENLRRHYALTLDCWAENFSKNWDKIHALDPNRFDERFRRRWNAYFRLCAEGFRTPNNLQRLYQITFSKGNTPTYPMRNDFIYRETNGE